MAVIYRKTAVGEAADLIAQGVQQGIAQGRTDLIALQQQRNILESQQALLTTQTRQSLGQIQENIYRTQRAKRAESAAMGLVGAVSELRDISQVQDEVAATLANVVNQAEQGAISIAGQQSALTQAEAQSAQSQILENFADKLIEQGDASISRDTAREVSAGLTGAFTGAIKGALGTVGAVRGGAALLDPTKGAFKKLGIGLGFGLGANMILNDFNKLTGAFGVGGGEGFLPDEWKMFGPLGLLGLGGLGGLAGRGVSGFIPKNDFEAMAAALEKNPAAETYEVTKVIAGKPVTTTKKIPKEWARKLSDPSYGNKIRLAKGEMTFKNVLDKESRKRLKDLKRNPFAKVPGTEISSITGKPVTRFGQGFKAGVNKIGQFTRVNPFLIAAGAALGGIVGGLTQGLDKKYKIDVDVLRQSSDTAQQLEALGVDLDALTSIVYNK